ncbi:hypothetical protein LF887_18985 [Chryseobacterium sp. MEBOG06]|uniref:hypothetical protein n=1 Tax=Chryseobacterium sp. MEBOG06 TaxID=2879938 RepID=UPI001F255FC8|nr:hypothetical protein [Chryseobacterium sp. MEBOG06]UKB83077.1 hypothetical protein LF887_18985 [Chryseobacterium sp. MEBOG06]
MRYSFLLFLAASIPVSAQVDTCPTYVTPEISIKKIQFLSYPEMEIENQNLKKLPIRKKITSTSITEYDKNGNIIKNTQTGSTQKNLKCTYTNGILTEKQFVYIADKDKIEASNRQALQQAEARAKYSNDGIIDVSYQQPNSTESLYTATLNSKNQVTSYRSQEFELSEKSKKLTSDQKTDITYQDGKISTIQSPDSRQQYFYQNGILVKRESQVTERFQERKTTEELLHDKNKNLIAIRYKEELTRNGEIAEKRSGIRDSVSYDQKNRMIRFGWKKDFSQYTYDKSGNLASVTDFYNNKENKRTEFVYDKNLLIKISEISGDSSSPKKYLKEYTYKNGLMTEVKYYANTQLTAKKVFEYNNKNLLTKALSLNPVYDREKGLIKNEFKTSLQTEYVYDGKFVIMKNNDKEALRYELY